MVPLALECIILALNVGPIGKSRWGRYHSQAGGIWGRYHSQDGGICLDWLPAPPTMYTLMESIRLPLSVQDGLLPQPC